MESKFDVNKLIEIANKYYPKFYKEFILIFNDNERGSLFSLLLIVMIPKKIWNMQQFGLKRFVKNWLSV